MERKKRSSHLQKGIPEQAVGALRSSLGDRLVAVVLFGSRARGEAAAESDWDLLVIAEGLPEHPLHRHALLKPLLPADLRGEVSLLAKTPAEFEGNLPALYLDIALDGRILYDPCGYAADRVGALRRIIDRAGLYRERTPAGDIWQWRNPPRGAWSLEWET